jgi:hypothetical protein
MNKKRIAILSAILIIFLVIIGFTYFVLQNKNKPIKDLSLLNDTEIIEILKTNKDIKEYTKNYPDFKIENKEILTKDSIAFGQNGNNLQPLYYGLELEDNRYMKVQLMDSIGSNGFFGIIDAKDSSVQKAFGILLFQTSANSIQSNKTVTVP